MGHMWRMLSTATAVFHSASEGVAAPTIAAKASNDVHTARDTIVQHTLRRTCGRRMTACFLLMWDLKDTDVLIPSQKTSQ